MHRESSHVLVQRAVARKLRLLHGAQFEVEVINGDGDDDDETQDETQHQRQHLLQLLSLVRDAFIRCRRREAPVSHTIQTA